MVLWNGTVYLEKKKCKHISIKNIIDLYTLQFIQFIIIIFAYSIYTMISYIIVDL